MEETKSLNSSENITSLIWKLSIGSTLAWEISKFWFLTSLPRSSFSYTYCSKSHWMELRTFNFNWYIYC